MNKKSKFTVQIGHGAYQGDNRYALCGSKTAAIEELRDRGFTRDHARALVNDVCSRPHGYAIGSVTQCSDIVEVTNRTDLPPCAAKHGPHNACKHCAL